jgi:hypothetical protein
MSFITFIYKVGDKSKSYYGKYCDNSSISDNQNDLVIEVKEMLIKSLNDNRVKNSIPALRPNKVTIGILAISSSSIEPNQLTADEIVCFDFYRDFEKNIYVNGRKIDA